VNERVKFVEHKGKQIFFIDYSKLHGQEYVDVSKSVVWEAESLHKKNMLLLIDFTNSLITKEVSVVHKDITARTHHLFDFIAMVGMDPLRRILSNTALIFVTNKVRFFKTMEEAKDWLVESASKKGEISNLSCF